MTENIITHIELRAAQLRTPVAAILDAAGVNWSSWWRWKNGKASPTLSTVQRIERALDEIERGRT